MYSFRSQGTWKHRAGIVVLAATVTAASVAAASWASIPDASGNYSICRKTTTKTPGAIRIIDSAIPTQKCTAAEAAMTLPHGAVFHGSWDAMTSYATSDIVVLNEVTYIASTSNAGVSPALANTFQPWTVLGRQNPSAGLQGPQGPQGADGPAGPQGAKGDPGISDAWNVHDSRTLFSGAFGPSETQLGSVMLPGGNYLVNARVSLLNSTAGDLAADCWVGIENGPTWGLTTAKVTVPGTPSSLSYGEWSASVVVTVGPNGGAITNYCDGGYYGSGLTATTQMTVVSVGQAH